MAEIIVVGAYLVYSSFNKINCKNMLNVGGTHDKILNNM